MTSTLCEDAGLGASPRPARAARRRAGPRFIPGCVPFCSASRVATAFAATTLAAVATLAATTLAATTLAATAALATLALATLALATLAAATLAAATLAAAAIAAAAIAAAVPRVPPLDGRWPRRGVGRVLVPCELVP